MTEQVDEKVDGTLEVKPFTLKPIISTGDKEMDSFIEKQRFSNNRGRKIRLSDIIVPPEYYDPISTGNALLDGIFSRSVKRDPKNIGDFEDFEHRKGIIPGSVTLFTGEAGCGKTTLMIFMCSLLAEQQHDGQPINPLFVTLEMSTIQLKFMADRFQPNDFHITEAGRLHEIKDQIFSGEHRIIVIDSLQLIEDSDGNDVTSSEMKQLLRELISYAKDSKVSLILVGHVTKNGKFAGTNSLKHMVDAHLHFSYDNDVQMRCLMMEKNRFGPTQDESKLLVRIGAVDLAVIHPSQQQEINESVTKVKSDASEKFDYEHPDVGKIIFYSNSKMVITAVGKTKFKVTTLTGTKEYHPMKKSAQFTGEKKIGNQIFPDEEAQEPKQIIQSASTTKNQAPFHNQ